MTLTEEKQHIPGYDYGSHQVAKSPITLKEWEELTKSALFSEQDVFYLRFSHDVLADQVDELLKAWRGIIFDDPHLRAYDEDPKTGQVDTEYAKSVGKRFGQWVLDTAKAEFDQAWLDYQYEIGLRHHRTKKNKTDGGHTAQHIRARDLIFYIGDRCSHGAVPREERPSRGSGESHVRRMVESGNSVGHAVVATVYPGRRFLIASGDRIST
jgi:hypothetical protein